jgi:hypothetical protein
VGAHAGGGADEDDDQEDEGRDEEDVADGHHDEADNAGGGGVFGVFVGDPDAVGFGRDFEVGFLEDGLGEIVGVLGRDGGGVGRGVRMGLG